jgi:signal transduction histidine kinase/CheY-like chemotaxis protein
VGRVVIVTPNEADAAIAAQFLAGAGIEAAPCGSLAQLIASAPDEVGCVIVVEEALVEPDVHQFQQSLDSQPPWSDLPLLLVAGHETSLSALADRVFPQSGNITLLQRPLHPVGLVSAVNVALRARARQYEVRDLLAERSRALHKRDEFLAMLAHELRNPLAPVRNAVYLLSTLDVRDPLFLKCRAMIDKQTRHMTRLVDDLLDVSRLELGKVELRLQPIDLNESVAAAVEACVPATRAQHHTVEVTLSPAPLPVMADPVRIEQVFCNLIVNAAKFTPPGGTIRVEASASGSEAVVRVADNGIGVKPEMVDAVFDLFTQDNSTIARTQGGLGIGLTLVKRLVELHGGSIRLASAGIGKGSTFRLGFPIAAAVSPASGAAASAPRARGRRRVLVIEDNHDIRDSITMLLNLWGHQASIARDGTEGVARALAEQPDVALVDIGLPGLDGYEVARRIRDSGSAWSSEVTLIALTGYGQASDIDRAREAGFDQHLLKPVDPAQLELLLEGVAIEPS